MRKIILVILIFAVGLFLRIYHLSENPPALYWDEASLGYNAYTIATALRDEHGEFLPISRFIAFGDYKPPGYIYASALSIKAFGLNEFAVRFPSCLAGFLMVVFTYFLVKELFKKESVSYLSAFFVAVSPWSLHISRAAFEANLAAFFNLAGIYFFLIARRKKWTIILSVLFLVLSFYTFNANRIISPLIFAVMIIIYYRDTISNLKWGFIAAVLGLMMVMPSYSYFKTKESKLRFEEVTIFNNLAPVEISNARTAKDGNNFMAKIIHNRRILFFTDFLKHYTDNFTGRFLFTHGDVNPRLSVQDMGQLFFWDLPFLLSGTYFLLKRKDKITLLIFSWMLIAPIPAGTARETPHALRIISILPTFQIITAYGLYRFLKIINKNTEKLKFYAVSSFVCFFFLVNFFYYLHIYYVHFPENWSGEWQYGYKQMVNFVSKIQGKYDQIFVTTALGRPYIYFAFYEKYDLPDYLKDVYAVKDAFGFWDVKRLGKVYFGGPGRETTGNTLIVSKAGKLPGDYKLIKKIYDLSGNPVFDIGDK